VTQGVSDRVENGGAALQTERACFGALAQFLQPSLDMGRPLTASLGGVSQRVVQLREPPMSIGSGVE
jgi:hypothetical protein